MYSHVKVGSIYTVLDHRHFITRKLGQIQLSNSQIRISKLPIFFFGKIAFNFIIKTLLMSCT